MFGTTTQKTADEAKRRIEALPLPQKTGINLNFKGSGVDVAKLAQGVRDQVERATKDVEGTRAADVSLPSWAWALKPKHRAEVKELMDARIAGGLSKDTDEALKVRLNRLNAKALRRTKKHNTNKRS